MRFFFWVAQKLRDLAVILDRIALKEAIKDPIKIKQGLDEYITEPPSPQNVIDALPGWNMALPPHVGVNAGVPVFYNDARITWAVEQFGSLQGKSVLELGPLEASHTYMLSQAGAGQITSIEANKLAFFRCLVVKDFLNIQNAKFLLGDFQKHLETTQDRFDLIVASGVLYHMQDPVRLLELIGEKSDSFFLWTHYSSLEAMPLDDPRRGAFVGDMEVQESHGVNVRLYRRTYLRAWEDKAFCGGMHDLHRWIEKDDIVALIRALGFDDVRIMGDQTDHPSGPSFSIFAKRTKVV